MKQKLLPFFIFLTTLNIGCLKDPGLGQLSSQFVVVTNTAPQTDFSTYQTYYVSDSVAYITGIATDTVINNASTQQLISTIKQNMDSRGYVAVGKLGNPDIGINVGVVKNTDVTVIYPGWWVGYPGWWDPWYWGWYYPYYYPWTVAYTVTTGTVIADLIDLRNATTKNSLNVIWGSVMGGAVGDDLNTNVQRGVDAINQAFAQTPQLRRN